MSDDSPQRTSFIQVTTENVVLPNGARLALDLVRHPGASAVVPFLDESHVLLIRQYRFATGGDIFEVPAGKLEGPEDPAACAARELEEEAGRRAGRIEALGEIWTSPGFTNEKIYLFAAFDLEVVPQRLEDDEVIELMEVPLAEALAWIWSGKLTDAKSAMALLHAAHWVGKLS